MQSSDVYDISKVRSQLFRFKFANELAYLQDNLEDGDGEDVEDREDGEDIEDGEDGEDREVVNKKKEKVVEEEEEENWITERINKLKIIVNIIDKHDKETQPKTTVDHEDINKLIYKKAWLRLPIFHKRVKLEEYLNNNLGEELSEKEIKNLVTKGIDLINLKKITSKQVIYNSNKGEIEDITCLTKESNIYTFEPTKTSAKTNSKSKLKKKE